MAKVTHLFRAPKKRAPMEELAEAVVAEDLRVGRLCTRAARKAAGAADG